MAAPVPEAIRPVVHAARLLVDSITDKEAASIGLLQSVRRLREALAELDPARSV